MTNSILTPLGLLLLVSISLLVSSTSANSLLSWGSNAGGQLGTGEEDLIAPSLWPRFVSPSASSWQQVALGRDFIVALGGDGILYGWGRNDFRVLSKDPFSHFVSPTPRGDISGSCIEGQTFSHIAATGTGVYLLTSSGVLASYGTGVMTAEGSIGDSFSPHCYSPSSFSFVSGELKCGQTTCGIITNSPSKQLLMWSDNAFGQAGTGNSFQLDSPVASSLAEPTPVSTSYSSASSSWTPQAFSIGAQHTVVLYNDGSSELKVFAFGNNNRGQLGVSAISAAQCKNDPSTNPTCFNTAIHQQITSLTGSMAPSTIISAGARHNLVVSVDGNLYAWGDNSFGQLSVSTSTSYSYNPVAVMGLGTSGINQIAAVADTSYVLLNNGSLVSFGYNGEENMLGVDIPVIFSSTPVTIGFSAPITITKLFSSSSASRSSLVLSNGNSVPPTSFLPLDPVVVPITWGENALGQCGKGSISIGSRPSVVDLSGALAGTSGVTDMASGQGYTVALADGRLVVWGSNDREILGTEYVSPSPPTSFAGEPTASSTIPFRASPTLMPFTDPPIVFSHVAASAEVGVAVSSSQNQLFTFGRNASESHRILRGQAGSGGNAANGLSQSSIGSLTLFPTSGFNLVDIKQLTCGDYHCAILSANNDVWTWGDNGFGQLGIGTSSSASSSLISISDTDGVFTPSLKPTQISCGAFHTLILRSDGAVVGFGQNTFSQLGNDIGTDKFNPILINFGVLSSTTASHVHAAYSWSVVLTSSGQIVVFGASPSGVLGILTNPSQAYFLDPVFINAPTLPIGQQWVEVASTLYSISIRSSSHRVVSLGLNGIPGTLGGGYYTHYNNTGAEVDFGSLDGRLNVKKLVSSRNSKFAGLLASITSQPDAPSPEPTPNNLSANILVVSWGDNRAAQLGRDGESSLFGAPKLVSPSLSGTMLQLAIGSTFSYALNDKDTPYVFGTILQMDTEERGFTLLGFPTRDVSVPVTSVGNGYVYVSAGGTRYTLLARNGAIGVGTNAAKKRDPSDPRLTFFSTVTFNINAATGFPTKTFTGATHSVLLTNTSRMYMWGYTNLGQTGSQNSNPVNTPSLRASNVDLVSVGEYHTMALVNYTNKIMTWGPNTSCTLGPVGSESTIFTSSFFLDFSALAIASGRSHNLILDVDGNVYSFGSNSYGQLGNAAYSASLTDCSANLLLVTNMPTSNPIIFIGAVEHTSFAIDSANNLIAWGLNGDYQAFGGVSPFTFSTDLPIVLPWFSPTVQAPYVVDQIISTPIGTTVAILLRNQTFERPHTNETTICLIDPPTSPTCYPEWTCINARWECLPFDVTGSGQIVVQSPIVVGGLTGVGSDLIFETIHDFNGPFINVTGCAAFDGNVTIRLSPEEVATPGSRYIPLLESSCNISAASTILLQVEYHSECYGVSMTSNDQVGGSGRHTLGTDLLIFDNGNCSPKELVPGSDLAKRAKERRIAWVAAVVIGILLLISVTTLVLLFRYNKTFHDMVAPFASRGDKTDLGNWNPQNSSMEMTPVPPTI